MTYVSSFSSGGGGGVGGGVPSTSFCGSQFDLTLGPLPVRDVDGGPPSVVFGRVADLESLMMLRKLEALTTGQNGRPKMDVVVAECGEL